MEIRLTQNTVKARGEPHLGVLANKRCALCFGKVDIAGQCVWGCSPNPTTSVTLRPSQLAVIALCSGPWVPCRHCRALGHINNVKCKFCDGSGRAYDPAGKENRP